MQPWLCKVIDRCVIKLAAALQPRPGRFPAMVEEARRLLGEPDFFCDFAAPPMDFKWTSQTRFEFSSAIRATDEKVNTVHGKLFRVGADWASKPTILLVHGWNDDIGYLLRHPYQKSRFLKLGLNVAMLELPYHLHRRPFGLGVQRDFICENLFSTIQAARQAVSDIRSMLAWLEREGCSRTGLWGVSLGGWLSGLIACHEPRVKFAVLCVPVARMDLAIATLDFCRPIRSSLEGAALDLEQLNLRSHRPKANPRNILVIEAVEDLFASRDAIEEFCEIWGNPEIHRIQHAHITGLFSPFVLNRGMRWASERALTLPLAK